DDRLPASTLAEAGLDSAAMPKWEHLPCDRIGPCGAANVWSSALPVAAPAAAQASPRDATPAPGCRARRQRRASRLGRDASRRRHPPPVMRAIRLRRLTPRNAGALLRQVRLRRAL